MKLRRRKFLFTYFSCIPQNGSDPAYLGPPPLPAPPFQENRVSGRHVDWDVIVELIGTGREESGEATVVWGGECFCRLAVVCVHLFGRVSCAGCDDAGAGREEMVSWVIKTQHEHTRIQLV